MSKTTIPTTSDINPKLVQERLLFLDTVKESFFGRFMDPEGNSIVHERTDFLKRKGDTMYFPIRYRITGEGQTGNQQVKGHEEALETSSFSLVLERYRKGVLDNGPLTRQRAPFSLTPEMRRALLDWGVERIDKLLMDAITASPTNKLYGGDATATTDIEAADIMTPALVSKAKVRAMTRSSKYTIPLNPIKINGKNHLVGLFTPDSMFDFKRTSEYSESVKDAMLRGVENPLFRGLIEGAEAIWDDVLMYSHANVPIFSTGGAGGNINYSQNMLLGAQSLVWGWGERPSIVEDDDDYEEFLGMCWRMTAKAGKPKFDSVDFGSFTLYTADTRVTTRTAIIP